MPRVEEPATSRYDAVVVGGGHNGLACAAYLAGAGRSVVVLERSDVLGGAVRSAPVFPGHDANLSKYSYLVSLLPAQIVEELGLEIELRRRQVSSYTPVGDGGVLVDAGDPARHPRCARGRRRRLGRAVRDDGERSPSGCSRR